MASAMILSTLASLSALQIISASQSGSYESFRATHGGSVFGQGTLSYEARRDLFQQRKDEVIAHNARGLSWKMAVNHFSDHTDEELKSLLGYRRDMGRHGAPTSSFLEIQGHDEGEIDISRLAKEKDWSSSLNTSSSWVRSQGGCGSCWAVAATGALEMHMEKSLGRATRLSHQQLVDCVLNPMHCGGTGGCDGATAELAFDHGVKHGISADDVYKSSDGKCNANVPSSLSVASFKTLPINKESHLLRAVATHGPVVVSVDGGGFFGYHDGVFSGCEKDTVVNHAVLAVGYGKDPASQKDYWHIRNSWGADWGEKGFLRLERHTSDSAHCGIDNKPKDGVFCDNAPLSVPVCGMCGVASDSAYPTISARQGSLRKSVASLVTNYESLK